MTPTAATLTPRPNRLLGFFWPVGDARRVPISVLERAS